MQRIEKSTASAVYPKHLGSRLLQRLTTLAQDQQIILSNSQNQLTADYFDPRTRAELISQVSLFREQTDRELITDFNSDDYEEKIIPGRQSAAEYPMGYCAEIRDLVFTKLTEWLTTNEKSRLADRILDFRSSGGILKQVYGIVQLSDTVYFQNSIQIGSLILDCAGDAGVSGQNPAVQLHSVHNGIYKNIDNFKDFYSTANKYWGARLIDTARYFPGLTPFFPQIMMFPDGSLHMPIALDLFFKNIISDFSLSENYLTQKTASTIRIPTFWRNYLSTAYGATGTFLDYKENSISNESCFKLARAYMQHCMTSESSDNQSAALSLLANLSVFGAFRKEDT